MIGDFSIRYFNFTLYLLKFMQQIKQPTLSGRSADGLRLESVVRAPLLESDDQDST